MHFSRGVRYQWGMFICKIWSKSLEPFLRYGEKTSKMPQKWGFSPICDPQDFFQKSGSVTFVPLWCSNFMQKIRKNQWTVSEIFKDGRTDHGRTNGQGRLLRTPSGKPWVRKKKTWWHDNTSPWSKIWQGSLHFLKMCLLCLIYQREPCLFYAWVLIWIIVTYCTFILMTN